MRLGTRCAAHSLYRTHSPIDSTHRCDVALIFICSLSLFHCFLCVCVLYQAQIRHIFIIVNFALKTLDLHGNEQRMMMLSHFFCCATALTDGLKTNYSRC